MPIQSKQQPPYYKIGTNIKQYVAYINQTGTGAPTANVLINTIGNIIWTRDSPGNYTGTLTDGFRDQSKTVCLPGGSGVSQQGIGYTLPFDHGYSLQRATADTVILNIVKTSDYSSVELSDLFADNQCLIEIYVYQ